VKFPKPHLLVLLSCCCAVLCNVVTNGQKKCQCVQTPSGGPVRPHHDNQNEASSMNLRFTQRSFLSIFKARLWLRTGSSVTQTPHLNSSFSMSMPTVLFSLSLFTSSHSMHSSLAFILASTLLLWLAPALCPIASPDDTSSFKQFVFHVYAHCSFLTLFSHSMHSFLHRHCCCGWHLRSIQARRPMANPGTHHAHITHPNVRELDSSVSSNDECNAWPSVDSHRQSCTV
jgi:hypothetical protein